MMRTYAMWKLTWPELKNLIENDCGIILPIGAIEQHGPHLPLMTDTYLPTKLALGLAEKINMVVAPPITYATNSRPLSGGGQTFIGTTSITATTFMNQLEEVIREFMRHGFKKIVLLNWHGENSSFVYEAAFNATDRGTNQNVKILVMDKAPLSILSDETMNFIYPDGFPGWNLEHAAILETSMMMYLDPELVLFDRAVDDVPPEHPWYDIIPIPEKFIAKSGSLWKATQSSSEKGERIWNELLNALPEIIFKEFA
jgi:creatinine amidohydrolase